MIKLKDNRYYVRFRRHGQDIMVVTEAQDSFEAKRIAINIKFLVKTGRWEALDQESLCVAVRLYQNRGWKIPREIFSQVHDVIEQELTLQEAARLCYQDPLIQTQTSMYRERLRQCFKRLFRFRGPRVPVVAIDVQFVKEYVEHRIKSGAALDTVRRERTALAQIFDILIEKKLSDSNPVRLMKWRPNKKNKKERRPFLSLADFQRLLALRRSENCPTSSLRFLTHPKTCSVFCPTDNSSRDSSHFD